MPSSPGWPRVPPVAVSSQRSLDRPVRRARRDRPGRRPGGLGEEVSPGGVSARSGLEAEIPESTEEVPTEETGVPGTEGEIDVPGRQGGAWSAAARSRR